MNGAKHKIHFLHLPLIIMLFAVNQAVANSGGGKNDPPPVQLSVKTNAVALGLAIANAAVEIGWGEHCSVNLPFYYSAWDYFNTHKKFRMLGVQPEYRYWLRRGEGWFFGIHAGVTYWNEAHDNNYRYQDHDGKHPAWGGGLAVGHRWQFNRHWAIEASLGGGLYHLYYDKFRNEPNGEWLATSHRNLFCLDQANLSIVYTFGKKGGRR